MKQSGLREAQISEHNFGGISLAEATETDDNTSLLNKLNSTAETSIKQFEEENDDINAENSEVLLHKDSGEGRLKQIDENYEQHDMASAEDDAQSDRLISSVEGRRANLAKKLLVKVLKEPAHNEMNSGKNLTSRLTDGEKKLSNANNSTKTKQKSESSCKLSDELPKTCESSLSVTANLKKNLKNKFSDISISFRKNDDTVNASELRQSEDRKAASAPRTEGKRNIIAAAQERGRAFLPELKTKFTGLSNRSPRLDLRRDWERKIQESGCKTVIIQV